jgi:hypothetical protein
LPQDDSGGAGVGDQEPGSDGDIHGSKSLKHVGRVLQWCYNGVARVLQECYKGVTMVLQGR